MSFLRQKLKFKKNIKSINDVIFLSKADGTYEVLYSKSLFLKKGDILSQDSFREVLCLYEYVFVTNDKNYCE